MAKQVAARLKGDDYQHVYSWLHVLELLRPRSEVAYVCVEDDEAGSADDVTVTHEPGAKPADLFFQIKYHVDQRGTYSSSSFMEHKERGTSLLQKLWNTWNLLRSQRGDDAIEITLLSNWTWDPAEDKFRSTIDGEDNRLKESFFTASTGTEVGKVREKWREHVGAERSDDFEDFARTLRFRLGFDCTDELKKRVMERMEWLNLRSDDAALLAAIGIIRGWIKGGTSKVTRRLLEETLRGHELYAAEETDGCPTVYLTTIKERRFDVEPDYVLDWRDHFEGREHKKGHVIRKPSDWNEQLLPELEDLERRVNEENPNQLVRVRGFARLSAWIAFGHVFSEVSGYTIEVDQRGELWRTDATPSADFELEHAEEEIDGDGVAVAVGLSVTGSLEQDVREHLAQRDERVSALLLVKPRSGLGPYSLRGAGDCAALADGAKDLIREFVKRHRAARILLYYFGPLSGACFVGHRLNAVCSEIQVMEDQQPGYDPSFVLR